MFIYRDVRILDEPSMDTNFKLDAARANKIIQFSAFKLTLQFCGGTRKKNNKNLFDIIEIIRISPDRWKTLGTFPNG